MSNGIKIPHPLKREGTYQFERFPEALEYDYVKLDERSLTDLVKQSAEYARFVKFCNELNIEDGSWQTFFDEIYDYENKKVKFSTLQELETKASTSPHLSLFLAFLQVFGIAQENLNTLTQKHLDFYYQNILQLQLRDEEPDKATLFFETEKNSAQVMVAAGTSLLAGKDANGKTLIYTTEEDLIVNKAKVESVKSIYVNKTEKGKILGIFASADAPADNAVLNKGTATGWLAFGPDTYSEKKAEIGFAIASPMFNLKEGKRRISLALSNENSIHADGLTVEFTSEKGWTEAQIESIEDHKDEKNNPYYILIKIDAGMPAVVPYNETVHLAGLNTCHPVIRIKLRNEEAYIHEAYQSLSSISVSQIKNILVQVSGIKNVLLQNDQGVLDNAKPFQPFGSQPAKHKSVFYIGSNDIFNKYLRSFNLAMSWKGLPGRIDEYYATYDNALKLLFPDTPDDRKKYFDTSQFQDFTPGHPPGKVSVLDNGNWKQMKLNKNDGFSTDSHYDPGRNRNMQREDSRNVFKTEALAGGSLESGYSYNIPKKYEHSAKSGFIKIELGYDFGHSKYQKLYTIAMLKMKGDYDNSISIPEQPYNPEFNSLHIDYTSSAEIDFNENQFFHLHPFGNEALAKDDTLIPQIKEQGQLLIGLSNVSSAETVSIHFCMENNSGNFDKTISEDNKPLWYYLSENKWKQLANSDLLKDSTDKFSGSGIIKFNLDSEAIRSHSVMPDHYVWLKAAVISDSDAFPALDMVRAQAVDAVFQNNENETSHLSTGLAAGTISKAAKKITGIKTISQPYISFGGRAKETNKNFETRISERLRHKDRSWNAWDYERLILEYFPSLLKAKCIPHTDMDYEYSPGNIYMILLPDINRISQKNILQPRVSKKMIEEVKEFLASYASPFVNFNVNSPEYEEIKVVCDVKLAAGYDDKTYYGNQLKEDLKSFIAPWIINSEFIPLFEGKIYKSQIINFMEECPYIDYISRFEVWKGGEICGETLSGSKENVILTSSENHSISTEGLC